MQWASALARPSRLEDAIEEAVETLRSELAGPPDLVFAFVSSAYSDHYGSLTSLAEKLPGATIVGCSAGGVIGAGSEAENQEALALLGACLPGVKIRTFHLDGAPETWSADLADEAREPEFIVIAEPFSCPVDQLIRWLDASYPGSTKIGGVASGCEQPGEAVLLLNGELHRTGAIGMTLTGNIEIDTILAQGCKPVGSPMFVTRSAGPVLYELDGKSPMVALEQLFSTLDEHDRELARSALFLGIVMNDQQEVYEHGDFLIRQIVGVDPEAQALAVGGEVREGSVVQFHLRDADTSATDLEELLARHQYGAPSGALLVSCVGRGRDLYGESGHDTRVFHEQMGSVPMGGFFGNGEIGPVRGETYLHSYTSAFALFRPRLAPGSLRADTQD